MLMQKITRPALQQSSAEDRDQCIATLLGDHIIEEIATLSWIVDGASDSASSLEISVTRVE
jgi:hypothetical protein